MITSEMCWKNRFSNYKLALTQLGEFLEKKELNKLEKQGLIQVFEYTHELAWKTLADFLKDRGNTNIFGSRDAVRKAFNLGLISDGDIWKNMVISRSLSSHAYDEEISQLIVQHIQDSYYDAFNKLMIKLNDL